MKKLDRLIIRSFFPPFVLTFFIALFVLLMQFLWKYVDDLIGKGLDWYIVGKLLFYASASMVPMALPLAMLLSSIMTYGSMGENYELFATKASGISLMRAMRPLIFTAIVISIAAFFFSNYYLPYANLKFGTLLFDIRKKQPALNISEGVFYSGIEGYSIRIGKKGPNNQKIKDITIYDHSKGNWNTNVLLADSGQMVMTKDNNYLVFTLYNGMQYKEVERSRRGPDKSDKTTNIYFEKWEKVFDLSEFKMNRTNETLFKDHEQMLNLSQLSAEIDTFKIEMQNKRATLDSQLSKYYAFKQINFDTLSLVDTLSVAPTKFIQLLGSNKHKKIFNKAQKTARSIKQKVHFTNKSIRIKQDNIKRHKIEWHRKFTWSVACFLLFLIGAPFGAVIRRGGLGLPLVITVILFILFHILTITGEKMTEQDVLAPYQGMWLAIAVFLPLAILLTYKSNNDSPLFNMESYYRFFRKVKSFIIPTNTNQ